MAKGNLKKRLLEKHFKGNLAEKIIGHKKKKKKIEIKSSGTLSAILIG